MTPHELALESVWIGPHFATHGFRGRRLILLAEREPSEEGHVPHIGRTFDAALTDRYIDGSMKHLLFTEVARLLLGRAATRPECEEFWNSVAFANAVEPTGGTPSRPVATPRDWQEARKRLPELLAGLEVNRVLVLGQKMEAELVTHVDAPVALARAAEERRLAVVPHPASAGFAFRDHVRAVEDLFRTGE